jgi:hypothetical protein
MRSVADMNDKTVTREDQIFIVLGYLLEHIKYQLAGDFPAAITSYNQARAKFLEILNVPKS